MYFPSEIFTNNPPNANQIKFGSLAICKNKIYTKGVDNNVIEICKNINRLEDLEDVKINNPQNNQVLQYNNGFWENRFFTYSFSNFVDAEFKNLQNNQTIIYDATTETFRNGQISYRLRDLLDFNKPLNFESNPNDYDDYILSFNSAINKFELVQKNNRFSLLEDVVINPDVPFGVIKSFDGFTWTNSKFQIQDDTNPTLGGNLNANFKCLLNQKYKSTTLIVSLPQHFISYEESEYWRIIGTNQDTILAISLPSNITDSVVHLLLEITPSTGLIQIGNLDNVVYSDGRPIQLSGNGKTDIISITVTSTSTIITMVARDLQPANTNSELNNYDKNRYPDSQNFTLPVVFDNFFNQTRLLLTFESTNNTLWYENKTRDNITVTLINVTERVTDIYNLNKRESVAYFNDADTSTLIATFSEDLSLDGDFTYEMFVQYEIGSSLNNGINQTLFNFNNTLILEYIGVVNFTNFSNTTKLKLTINTNVYEIPNALLIFKNALNYYFHIALVRLNDVIYLMLDGIKILEIPNNEIFTVNKLTISNLRANINSVRLTTKARYDKNLITLPNMKFPLLGVFEGDKLFEDIVMNKWYFMGEIENPIAYMMYTS